MNDERLRPIGFLGKDILAVPESEYQKHVSEQSTQYYVHDGNGKIVWKGTVEEFSRLMEDAASWREHQAQEKQRWTLYQEQKRGTRVQEPEYLRDTELLP